MASLHGSSAILAMDPRNSPRHQQRRQRIGSKRSSTCENQWKVRVMKLRVRVEGWIWRLGENTSYGSCRDLLESFAVGNWWITEDFLVGWLRTFLGTGCFFFLLCGFWKSTIRILSLMNVLSRYYPYTSQKVDVIILLGGGFNFLFLPLHWERIQFDYFSNRLKPPPRLHYWDRVMYSNTVDGSNPAPVDRWFLPLFTRFYTSQVVVWDFGPATVV